MNEHSPKKTDLDSLKSVAHAQTKIRVAESLVVDSGSILTTVNDGLTIHVMNLTYEIVFEDDSGNKEQKVKSETIGEKILRLHLTNFNNSLGTSLRHLKIGDISETPLWLSLYVEAVGKDVRVVTYTVYLGGNFG